MVDGVVRNAVHQFVFRGVAHLVVRTDRLHDACRGEHIFFESLGIAAVSREEKYDGVPGHVLARTRVSDAVVLEQVSTEGVKDICTQGIFVCQEPDMLLRVGNMQRIRQIFLEGVGVVNTAAQIPDSGAFILWICYRKRKAVSR